MVYEIYFQNWFFAKKSDASCNPVITYLCRAHNMWPAMLH